MEKTAFLSFRVPEGKKSRVKEIAARKGVSIQTLLGAEIDDLLRRERQTFPDLASVIAGLRAHGERLRARGVSHLHVFGSVARGEAAPGSDIDLAADFDPAQPMSLVRFASLKCELEDILGHAVDFVDRAALKPEAGAALEQDAVEVF